MRIGWSLTGDEYLFTWIDVRHGVDILGHCTGIKVVMCTVKGAV
jgi:hypothetical protein